MKLTSKNIFTDDNGIKGYIWYAHIAVKKFLDMVQEYELTNFHHTIAYDERDVKQMYFKKTEPSDSEHTIFTFISNEKFGYEPCTMMYR
jgi:hypothetical protein